MKPSILSLLVFFISTQANSQTVFVNLLATGNNDGSTWENAFIDLGDALADNSAMEIWMANGTYISPQPTTDSLSSYFLNSNVSIYGGFVGDEISKDDRDLSLASTIISGDRSDNDNGSLEMNRSDNDRHVLFIMEDLEIKLDQLTIEGGHTSINADLYISNTSGGGIYSLSALNITNCTFRSNYGRSGASIAVLFESSDAAEDVTFSDCIFENNLGTTQSAGAVIFNGGQVSTTRCTFKNNETNRGAFYPSECNKVDIIECAFENNFNSTGFGGALFTWQVQECNIRNCTFTNNQAENAGACYFDGRELEEGKRSVTIQACSFSGNRAIELLGGFGGAVYSYIASADISNCNFFENQSRDGGGGIFSSGDSKNINISGSLFEGNIAAYGGALTSYFGGNTVVDSCTFSGNRTSSGGGAINVGFKNQMNITNSEFEENFAPFGGAVAKQNDTTSLIISKTKFANNNASSGGALFIFSETNGPLSLVDCVFDSNSGDVGGAAFIQGHENSPQAPFEIETSRFINNSALSQGGALNLSNVDGHLTNVEISSNEAQGGGVGGAISLNAGTVDSELILQHCTVAGNSGSLAGGVAAWGVGSEARYILRNTLFNNGKDFEVEDGRGRFISEGGNMVSDPLVFDSLDLSVDFFNNSPGFVDQMNGDYHLGESSPSINAGLATWTTATDLDGNTRDALPDIGCYEYIEPSSSKEILNNVLVQVFPNPASNYITISEFLDKNTKTSMYDSNGRHLYTFIVGNERTIDVSNLSSGLYYLRFNDKDKSAAKFIVE